MLDEIGETQHVGAGFALMMVAVALLWNLDWRHYARYWLGRSPSARWVRIVRIFLLLNFIGSLSNLLDQLHKGAFAEGLAWILLDAVLFAAIFLCCDGVFRFFWRHQPKIGSG